MFSRILYPRIFIEFILHILFFFLRILKLLLPCRKENTSNFLKKIVDTGFVKIYGEHVNDANKHFISNVFFYYQELMVSGSMIVWWLHCPTPSLNWWHTAGIVCQNTSHSWNSSGLNILGLSCAKVFYCFLTTGCSLSDWVILWLSQNMTTDFSGIYLNRTCVVYFLFLVRNQSDKEHR